MCIICANLQAARDTHVAELRAQFIDLMCAEGDEYHADLILQDLAAALSLARLVHAPVYGCALPPEAGPANEGFDNEEPWGETGSAF